MPESSRSGCWPLIRDPGLVCACGEFKINGVRWDVAQERWREHFRTASQESAVSGGER